MMFQGVFIGKRDMFGSELNCGDRCSVLMTDWPSKSLDDLRDLTQYMDDISSLSTIRYNEKYCCFEFLCDGGHTLPINVGAHGRIIKLESFGPKIEEPKEME